ncbi:MAG: hypothetical protein MUO62_19610 [Anaerolineales bacterium]|nr:hypothetical protein [Anaerolineales bacterium]
MIIHEPETIHQDGHTLIWSVIEFAKKRENYPETLWYRVPEAYAGYLSPQSDAFLVPGLLAGMYYGEDIEVRGRVSPRLAYSLAEYQFVLHFRMPEVVSPVEIKYSHLQPSDQKPAGVGSAFSGGVDSLFTLWEHLPQNQPIPEFQVTHGLFIMGFDIRYADKDKYKQVFLRYQRALDQIQVGLVPLETNLVSAIIPRMTYSHFYGPILAGSAHLFAGLWKRFIIPSSRDYKQLRVWTSSSDPLSDPLLSADTLEILHHGATHRRVEKIQEISEWKFAQDHLRVCFKKEYDTQGLNCSRCEKCTRTMVPIYALGKMEAFSTFKKPFRTNRDGLWLARKFNPTQGYGPEFFPIVKKYKPDFLPWLTAAYLLGYLRYGLLKLIPGFIRKRLQRFGHFVDPLKEPYAFDDLAIIELIRSQLLLGDGKNDHPST